MSRNNSLLGAEQAHALLGAWQEIVGYQQSGVPTHIQHGVYGGHRHHHHGGYPQYAPQYYAPQGYYAQPAPQYYAPPAPPQYDSPYDNPNFRLPPRNQLVDRPGPTRADRITLPMSSGVNILPNTSAQITSRPQNVAFRPERIIIGGSPSDWIVNDIKVGNRSQFSQSGDVPGEMFAATTIDSFVSMETVQTAMDFVMLVTFVGASESGAPFVCGVLGTAAI